VLGEQEFCIADAAAETQYTRGFSRSGGAKNTAHHVFAQRTHGWGGENPLRVAGVERFVVSEFAIESFFGQIPV
jgi:hypothetical protein